MYQRRNRGKPQFNRVPRVFVGAARFILAKVPLEEYKSGHISKPERYQLDGFLKDHGVLYEYTIEDFQQERADLRRLGF